MAELFEVKIPHSGSVENVEITEWSVSVGDVVAEGDVLAEVSTDKVDTELEAPAGRAGSRSCSSRRVPRSRGHGRLAAGRRDQTPEDGDRPPCGNYTRPVMDAAARPGAATGASAAPEVLPTCPRAMRRSPSLAVRLRARRRAIARNLEVSSRSRASPPTCRWTSNLSWRLGPDWNNAEGAGQRTLSVLAFVATRRRCAHQRVPQHQRHLHRVHRLLSGTRSISASQWTPRGPGRPRRPGRPGPDVAAASGAPFASWPQRARDGELTLDDLTGGTFTISNPGCGRPVIRAEALLNPPQVALLGLPALKTDPSRGRMTTERSRRDQDRALPLTDLRPSRPRRRRSHRLPQCARRIEEWTLAEYMADPPRSEQSRRPR